MEDFARLKEKFPKLKFEPNYSFARHTTIGCGGTAACCVYPDSTETVAELISYLSREKIPHCFLGAGANVLPAEGEYAGVVIKFSGMQRLTSSGELVEADAGVTGGRLLKFSCENALSGFEPFTGIPMTIGGGVTMNAGIPDLHFADVVEKVTAVEKGKIYEFSNKDCGFSQKESIFQSGIAVTKVILRGGMAQSSLISEREKFYRERRKHLPKGRSMGCVFVNPPGVSAGKLIDECGLKGRRVGGAVVSEIHANFIINEGGTSDEIAELIEIVKQTVKRGKGILLREEIRRIGNT